MCLVDKDITRHLQFSGHIDDDWGLLQVENFINQALKKSENISLAEKYGCTKYHFIYIYVCCIRALGINPCLKAGISSMLVPTLIFLEPQRLDELLNNIVILTRMNGEQFEQATEKTSSLMAIQIQNTHDLHYGESDFRIVGQGGDPLKLFVYK
jgi:hypothetical protein